jgi:phosphotriesterase-related protein
MIADITDGVQPSGIKAGIIGEIGTSATMTRTEEKVLRAAARASQETGVSMVIHVDTRGNEACHIVDVLESERARLDRAVLSHQDVVIDTAMQIDLARKGAYIAYDTFGQDCYIESWVGGQQFPSDTQRIQALQELIAAGCLERLLISQDVCMKTHLHRYGRWGYDHILVNVLPMMRKAGLSEAQIHTLLVDNPRRVLTPTA